MLVTWQKRFQNEALDNGFVDYQEGLVTGLKKSPYGFEATVAQDEVHTIEIHVEGTILTGVRCSCGEDDCRHAAAVLMTLDEMLPCPLTVEMDEESIVEVKLSIAQCDWEQWHSLALSQGRSVESLMIEWLRKQWEH